MKIPGNIGLSLALAISDALAREGDRIVMTGRRKSLPVDPGDPSGPVVLKDTIVSRLGGSSHPERAFHLPGRSAQKVASVH